jgi:hypothetical protein
LEHQGPGTILILRSVEVLYIFSSEEVARC